MANRTTTEQDVEAKENGWMTGFVCLRCGAEEGTSFRGYLCPACGGNLDVTYDVAALRRLWEEGRLLDTERADMFRYRRLMPIRDLTHAPRLRVGNTPLLPAPRLGEALGLRNVFLKDDGLNPSGSFKDRASALVIARARELGADVVAAASTGNAGSAMACMAASLGMPAVIFVPESAPRAKLAQLLIFGAHVIAVQGNYDDAFDLCSRVCEARGWFNRNTGLNPYTREGKKSCSFELCEQRNWVPPDWVIVCTGDGNIISGIWKGFRDLYDIGSIDRLPRLVAAQAEGSAAITRAVQRLRAENAPPGPALWRDLKIEPVEAKTVADSISVDDPRDGLAAVRCVLESGGDAVAVPDEEILAAIQELGRRTGVFAEPSAAASVAVLRRLAAAGSIGADDHVVCLISGSGLKDVDAARRAAGEPHRVAPDLDATLSLLEQLGLS